MCRAGKASSIPWDQGGWSCEHKAEAARCQIRPPRETWTADAFVVDEAPAKAEDDDRSTCGAFGVYGGTTEFWRLSQGKGWFFRFGEETPIVDAESVTLVKRHAAGKWVRS